MFLVMQGSNVRRDFLVLLSVMLTAASCLFLFYVSTPMELFADQPRREERARKIIAERKCGNCHTLQARGLELKGKVGPELTHQARRKRSAQWLTHHLTSSFLIPDHGVVPGIEAKKRLMPSFNNLSEQELTILVEFLRSLD